MAIYRISKKDNYVVLDKGFLNDPELSWQAKGLLSYMLSLPNDWEFKVSHLKNQSKNGRDATYRIMKELIDNNYVTRVENRESGKFGSVEYIVHEVKQGSPHTESQETVSPYTEKPYTENPYPDSQELLNNNQLSNNSTNMQQQQQEDSGNPFIAYQKYVGRFPSPLISEQINQWIDEDGIEQKAIALAIYKTAMNGSGFAYTRGIVENWLKKGIKTYDNAVNESKRGGNEFDGAEKVPKHRRSDGRSQGESEEFSIPEPNINGVDTSTDDLF